MEEKIENGAIAQQEEKMYPESEVRAILDQYRIKYENMLKSAQEEIDKRDLGNFYQTLSVLFEVIRNRDAYSSEFIQKAVSAVEKSVNSIFEEPKEDER